MTESAKPAGRGRRQFLGLAALFFAPVILAYLYYFVFPEWQPSGKTHHGQLIDPARTLPDLPLHDAEGQDATHAFKGKWTLLYLGSADCAKSCQDKLFETRQIRTLLNEKRDRVQRIYAAPDAAGLAAARTVLPHDVHPDLKFLNVENAGLREFLQPAGDADAIYLFDPLGNWLMVYPSQGDDYKGILTDIKKLLRLSQIG